MLARTALAAALWLALSGTRQDDEVRRTPVDPLTIADDDFARHRDPAEWRGLAVSQIEFREERGAWRLFRIVNVKKPRGPLWFVPHDNENAGFEAALAGVRKHGGVVIAIDSGIVEDGRRRNGAVDRGRPIDPNRNFRDGYPRYANTVLADYRGGARPIIALHTNSPGFDTSASSCNRSDPPGRGEVSIRFCDDVMQPSPSRSRAWPFDDDDTLAYVPWRSGTSPATAWCGRTLDKADFNVVFERVGVTDGSLSNYALLRGLDYVNFETRERGLDPAALAESRNRLTAMVDRALTLCLRR
ncbi:hypothetical protein CA223_06465 [Sphingomonas koreensis]|jgi:hypothetical protein|uniref:Uncharacterized protein n=1 Tax=Sphingomonas koreensis TaxID=93064 RepID=A0A1L6JCI0_9SPHN|nr:hypothetical protein [Sphingomonas koreensis]APR53527.1 hypothetical protein BRX40_14815 [Sphingomonas koreensis]MDC7809759.1 hypothetical protein [Sphingomonas koreensis]RSU21017.1 hypothetical protein CA222_19765 [Sphingomonas koreensis]RSU22056.1 hypothetical protein CA225_20320 [Sphingomonas koreensis]RSU24342.1 hypothetical protein CA224_01020 [Sphingomonas koreensis]